MEQICLEEIKKIELDILSYVDNVCKENGLRYFLCGGTLLGAIRHKGFIPWDDDIDIIMPRPDYDKLLEIIKSNTESKYKLLSIDQKDYYYNFSKIVDSETELHENAFQDIENLGVYIDIFPLEGMPLDEKLCKKHFKKIDKVRKRINSFAIPKPKIRKNLFEYFKSIYYYTANKKASLTEFQNKYLNLVRQYDYNNSTIVYATGGAYGMRDIFSKELFLEVINVEFEGHYFYAPKEYDRYLKGLYGNYMELPPINKRVSNHCFEAKYK